MYAMALEPICARAVVVGWLGEGEGKIEQAGEAPGGRGQGVTKRARAVSHRRVKADPKD